MAVYELQLAVVPANLSAEEAHRTFYWTRTGPSSFESTYEPPFGSLSPSLGRMGPVKSANADFVRLAVAVFAADRTTPREAGGSNWNQREIELTVPVAVVEDWQSVVGELETLFDLLTGDSWHFRFSQLPVLVGPVAEPRGVPKRIVLLSGGADSAIGALLSRSQLGAEESHTLLSHVGFTNLKPIQTRVATRLRLLVRGPGQRHVQVTLLRKNVQPNGAALPSEPSSRSRSALFLALGLAEASIHGVPLWIPENGFASLNPPLGPERRGSLSTKTTHPAFLGGLRTVLPKVGAHADIFNPFEDKTKGEMFRLAIDLVGQQSASELLSSTHSCGITGQRAFGVSPSLQCGVCFGCFVRRASFAASGLRDESEYIDASSNPRLAAWLVGKSVERSVLDFVRRGIRVRDIAALGLPADYPADRALDLCRRASEELQVLLT
jgi:7-cyano-7-deazaguanine synthase in queuosine biosynthesis